MDLNVKEWKEFQIGKMFEIYPTKDYKGMSNTDLDDGGTTPVIANSAVNNGINGFSTLPPTEKGNIITFSDTTEGNTFFYQPDDFIGFAHVQGMHPIGHKWTEKQLLFLATVLTFTNCNLFNYGRKMRRDTISNSKVKLPAQKTGNNYIIDEKKMFSDDGYIPDWEFMDSFIRSLNYHPPKTKIDGKSIASLNASGWEEFTVSDLFKVQYGINMELNACDETTSDDPDGVAFVARTSENNGVSAYVKKISGKEPQPAETITVAGGGSVLSTFVQKRPFYSGRDLYLLLPKTKMILQTKMFICTVLSANQYRYSYGRQANKTLPYLILKLPVLRDTNGNPVIDETHTFSEKGYIPDWQFMNDYINSLPYSDRI